MKFLLRSIVPIVPQKQFLTILLLAFVKQADAFLPNGKNITTE